MRWWFAALASGCGYSSYWPETPTGVADTGVVPTQYTDGYHQPGPVACSDPYDPDAMQLTLNNNTAQALELYAVDPADCAEDFLGPAPSGVGWSGTTTDNLVFVVRGLDGGLVKQFRVVEGSTSWVENAR